MSSPFFSVIVPVYNVEKYLHECVDSILNQSFTDFEVILVDDGSPDNCPQICDQYAQKDSRVKVIHKPNGGVSSARNAGLQRGAGKYVVFCDGDDRLQGNYLEEMYRLISMPGIDLAVCGFESVDKNGNPTCGRRSIDCDSDSAPQHLDHNLFWKLFQGKRLGSCCDKIFRMDLIRRHGLEFPLNIPLAEDTDFVLRYLAAAGDGCSVAVTDERLYLYLTLDHGSAVQTLRPNQWNLFERLFPMLEEYVSNDTHKEALREYICSAVWFVTDGLLCYSSILSYHQFRAHTADMLRSGYFRDAARSPKMNGHNRVLTAALKSGSVAAVWCFYLAWKAKCFLRGK